MRPVAALLLLLNLPALAWNATGHRVVAAIAYDLLKPDVRARVNDLIRRHPDYNLFLRDAPSGDSAARARTAFVNASIWADQIKSDPRFYDDDRRDPRPTPLLPGFPDMARRQYWHFVNLPFSQDGSPLRTMPPPHIVTELERLTRELRDPAKAVYALPWVLHLVGDLHNPLHAVARFSRQLPNGDRGGNDVYVTPGRNLHSFWDGLLGPETASWGTINALTQKLTLKLGQVPLNAATTPSAWAKEGVDIAKKEVYRFGAGSGTVERPMRLNEGYQKSSKSLVENRISTAGVRLAALLNLQVPR